MQPFENAVAAYRAGQFEVAFEAVSRSASPASLALAVRALVRLNRPADALEHLAAIPLPLGDLGHQERAELEMLRSTALARAGRSLEAAQAFDETRPYVFAAACPELEAEFYHLEAQSHLLNRELDRCEAACAQALAPAPRVYGAQTHFTPLAHTRARVCDLLAAVAASRRDYAAQLSYLKDACHEMAACPVADDGLRALMLAYLSMLVRETGDVDDAAYVRTSLESIAPIPELQSHRYAMLHSLGWANALRGDHLGAFRDLRAAGEAAPTILLKVRASLDKAYLARELHQTLTAGEEIDYAERLSEAVSWDTASAMDLPVLLALAQALAADNSVKGRRLYNHYRRLRKASTAQHAGFFDERARVDEIVADATICRSEGNVKRAVLLFETAFEKWNELGYEWRAALAAIELAELGAGPRYTEFARAVAGRRPTSWFASRASALPAYATA
jgi:hypothetical protein